MVALFVEPEHYAIVSLAPDAPIPAPPLSGFYTCIRDKNEVTLVLPETFIPASYAKVTKGYRIVMLDTDFPFDVIGVLAACSSALAQAGIPVMAYSSYKTDIFMFQAAHFEQACTILAGLTL